MNILLMTVLLKAHYTPVAGTDPEYGQGAIERNELRHREVMRFVWLFAVDDDDCDAAEWQRRLNAAVDPRHGSFVVDCPTGEEEEGVRTGRIVLQR